MAEGYKKELMSSRRQEGKGRKSTHDGSLELSHDANDIGRVGRVMSNSLGLEVRVGDSTTERSSEDRSDERKSE